MLLTGTVAVVNGGTDGIGLSAAKRFKQMGVTFVARGFTGDKERLMPLIKDTNRSSSCGLH
jgi:NAD(P)-dependent dehydrogenase (short-subunit alcohol dehydrogenase family)